MQSMQDGLTPQPMLPPGDRLVTPWLKILGKGAPETPMLKVSFVRTQEALRSVSIQVRAQPCIRPNNSSWAAYLLI